MGEGNRGVWVSNYDPTQQAPGYTLEILWGAVAGLGAARGGRVMAASALRHQPDTPLFLFKILA